MVAHVRLCGCANRWGSGGHRPTLVLKALNMGGTAVFLLKRTTWERTPTAATSVHVPRADTRKSLTRLLVNIVTPNDVDYDTPLNPEKSNPSFPKQARSDRYRGYAGVKDTLGKGDLI